MAGITTLSLRFKGSIISDYLGLSVNPTNYLLWYYYFLIIYGEDFDFIYGNWLLVIRDWEIQFQLFAGITYCV